MRPQTFVCTLPLVAALGVLLIGGGAGCDKKSNDANPAAGGSSQANSPATAPNQANSSASGSSQINISVPSTPIIPSVPLVAFPNVAGQWAEASYKTLRDAKFVISDIATRSDIRRIHRVIDTVPKSTSGLLPQGTSVEVIVGDCPNFVGMKEDDVVREIKAAGVPYQIGRGPSNSPVGTVVSVGTVAEGYVGTLVPGEILLSVSSGPAKPTH